MMYLLITQIISLFLDEVKEVKYVMYDMVFGASEGLRIIKKRLGFRPYRVQWQWCSCNSCATISRGRCRSSETRATSTTSLKLVRAYSAKHPEIVTDSLPAMPQRAIPVEAAWGHARFGRLANFALEDTRERRRVMIQEFDRLHRRPDLLASFLRPARIPVRPQPFVLLDRLESVVVHGLPRREVMRQGPPGATIAVAVKMASSTRRISVLRGRPPGRAGGIKGPRMAHGLSVKSLGYGFGGFDLGSMSQMSGPFGRGWPHTQRGRTMPATIVTRSETSFTFQVEIPYSSSMPILGQLKELLQGASSPQRRRYSSWTSTARPSRSARQAHQQRSTLQGVSNSLWGRHVHGCYRVGGQGPRLAGRRNVDCRPRRHADQTPFSASGRVLIDLEEHHGRRVARSFVQNVADAVATVALAQEESWNYALPAMDHPVTTITLGLDGTCVLMCEDGWLEAMVGTIGLYDKAGERQHTIYMAATPEYGKATFLDRMDREVERVKVLYPEARYVGIADGARGNWDFLEPRTETQIVDFYQPRDMSGCGGRAVCGQAEGEGSVAGEPWSLPEARVGCCGYDLEGVAETGTQGQGRQRGGGDHVLRQPEQEGANGLRSVGRGELADRFGGDGSGMQGDRQAAVVWFRDEVERAWCGGGVEGSVRCLTYTKERWSQFWNKIGSYGLPVTAKGGKMNYADYLIRQGERLFEGGGTRWKIYHKALVPASPIPTFTQLTLEEAKAILNQSNAHFIRWSSDPTEEPTAWWWNVCSSYDKSKLSSNMRRQIKRGTRLCTVDRVSAPWLAQHGYECYVSAFQRYTNASPEPFESFRTRIMETADYEDLFQYWAVFCEGRLVGYVKCDIEPKKGVSTNVLKYNPEGLKQYASYALMDTLLTSYVVEKHFP